MICWLQFDLHINKPDTIRHHGVRIYDNSKQEECGHLMPASLVYSKSVIECLLHCLLNISRNIRDAFFYVIPASTEKLWYWMGHYMWRSQPDSLVMLCKFKSLSLFISLEIDSLYGL